MQAIDLVLVGNRPGALHAAARLGLNVLLVDDRTPSAVARRRVAEWLSAPLERDSVPLSESVREHLGDREPRAVVASGERGVLGAAALRTLYGLAGVTDVVASRARDKPTMKAAARAAGVPCTDWLVLEAASEADELVEALGLPVVIKQRAGVGSRELVRASSRAEVRDALTRIPAGERSGWMAERFVKGVEMSVESFLLDGRTLLVNPTEYYRPAFANIAPARLDDEVRAAVEALNAAALDALDIRVGMTHLELFLTEDGPMFGEVAVRPPGGRIMRLLRRAYGFDPWEALIRLELGEQPQLPARAARAAGVWMLHPGAGNVRSVRGLAAARRIRGVRKLVCRIRAGSVVTRRESTGADVGWIEVTAPNRDRVAERLQAAYDLVRIEME